MLVSLSRAREQYKQGLPFKADFDEFIRGLFIAKCYLTIREKHMRRICIGIKMLNPINLSFAARNFSKIFFQKKIFVKRQISMGTC